MPAQQPLQFPTVTLHDLRPGGDPGDQGRAVRIQHRVHPVLPGHADDLGVDIGRERRRNASRHYQPIVGAQPLPQLRQQLSHETDVRLRSGVAEDRVDVTGFVQDGDVRPHLPLGVNEVTLDPLGLQRLLDVAPEAAGREPHGNALAPQLVDHPGDVYALAAGVESAGLDAQRIAGHESLQDQGLIYSGVKGDGEDHDDSGSISP